MPSEYAHTVCPHDCPSTCALEVERLNERQIGAVRGARDNSYTAGIVCAKVARYAERVHHPDRLTHPLQRTGSKGSASFRRISWEDALDTVAEAFELAAARYGSEAVWPYQYAGTMGLVQRLGLNRLRHTMRYSGQKETICTALADAGWLAGAGRFVGADPREMAESDLIVVWGGNPASTQVNVMTHITRARKARGAKFVVVDPYRTRSAAVADMHLALRPGTDGALACAVMHVLFKEDLADRTYLAKYTDNATELEAHLASRDPAWAANITGLNAEEIIDFARIYGQTKRSFLRLGYGFSRSRNGAANMHAAASIAAITGAWQYKGGGALYSNRDIYQLDRELIEGLDVMDPAIRMLDMSRIGPVLTHDRSDLGDGPPVTAMLIQNTNPAVVAPEIIKVHEGLARSDLFLCVHEQFLTETAAFADIVLPATTFLEHDDIYQGGGHSYLQIGPRIIEPLAEARSNHEVHCALAERLGARHRGFQMSAWEIIDETLRISNWPDAETLKNSRWHDCMPDFETAHHLNGFPTPTGRFQFAPDWASVGPDHAAMPALPDHMPVIDECDDEHPFRLVAAPAHNFLNSSFTEMPTSRAREDRPSALIHADDMDELDIPAGARVRLGNRRASVVVHAKAADGGQQRGVIVVEGIWFNNDFGEKLGINALISAEAAPPNGGAAFHDTAIWLRPAN